MAAKRPALPSASALLLESCWSESPPQEALCKRQNGDLMHCILLPGAPLEGLHPCPPCPQCKQGTHLNCHPTGQTDPYHLLGVLQLLCLAKAVLVAVLGKEIIWPGRHGDVGLVYMYGAVCTSLVALLAQLLSGTAMVTGEQGSSPKAQLPCQQLPSSRK